jgi:hypothetical protein
MRRKPDFLEVCAAVCTIIVALLSIAEWWLKVWT